MLGNIGTIQALRWHMLVAGLLFMSASLHAEAEASALIILSGCFVTASLVSLAFRARKDAECTVQQDPIPGILGNLRLSGDGQRIDGTNARLASMLDYPEKTLLGCEPKDLVPPDQLKALESLVQGAGRTDSVVSAQFCLLRASGHPVQVLAWARKAREGVSIEIIERDLLPPDLRALSEKVARTLIGIAHDLNNPLGAIRLHAEMIGLSNGLESLEPVARTEILSSLAVIDQCIDRVQSITALRRNASNSGNA